MIGKKPRLLTGKRIIVIVVGLLLLCLFSTMSLGFPKQDYTLHDVDLSTVPDGDYQAEYNIVPPIGTFAANKRFLVEVTVLRHRITQVTLIDPLRLRSTLDTLGKRVVERQTPKVDGITAGTWSNTSYLKAVEAALVSGRGVIRE
jgi:uncharacterized protein with FMN-binding domain